MAQGSIDRFVDLYAHRTAGMAASEVRALFAVASRPEVVSFAGGMPFVEALPADDVLDVIRATISDGGTVSLQYGSGHGHAGLRGRISMLMAEEGAEVDPEDVVITNGAQQGLDLLGRIFCNPGDLIAVEAPAYVGALTAFGTYEPRYLTVDMDGEGMVVDGLEQALIRGERPKFVYTVPNFANPSGETMSYNRREQLIALCREASIPIVEDNPYGMLRFEGAALPTLRSMDPQNVIYLGTVSKIFSPAMRVGWVLAQRSVVDRLVLAKEAADLCGSSLTMLVTEHYLTRPAWKENLARLVDIYRSRRDAMLQALDEHFPSGATWNVPAGGFYVWVRLPAWIDTRSLLAAAVERLVAYVPGTAFYPDGRGADHMRLSFCYPTPERIREGIARLGALLHDEERLYRSLSP